MAENDIYISWLNDAYAMEKNVEEVLEEQVKQSQDYPAIQGKIQEHLDVTRSQAERVKTCIERNGGKVSALKTGMANVMGTMMGVGTGMAKDKLIKNVLSDIATENFEMASYAAIITAANTLGDNETAIVCKQIYDEESTMEQWLNKELPTISDIALREAAR
jgi:ferritin-like metal-binding protein YciE